MIWQTKPIIEEELKNMEKLIWFTTKFIRFHQNLHNGETCKFENHVNEKDERYFQFKTIIKEENTEYFIYDEIIKNTDKTFYLLRLYDDKRKKVWELLIYFENNEIIEQIRSLGYEQFFNEIKNGEKLIKAESKNTIIIRTSFLEFAKTIDNQEEEVTIEIQQKYLFFKKFIWCIFEVIVFFLAWGAIAPVAKIIITPLVAIFITSSSLLVWLPVTISGIFIGICVTLLVEVAKKIKKRIFTNLKDSHQVELEKKITYLKNNVNTLAKEVRYLKDISLSGKEVIEERNLNFLQKIRKQNELRTFKALKKELDQKFKKTQFLKKYSQSIKQWNEKWQENIEFLKYLKPHHIKEIKDVFVEDKKEKFQIQTEDKTKEIWSEFKEWKDKLRELEKEESKTLVNGFTPHKDNRQKSPVNTIKARSL